MWDFGDVGNETPCNCASGVMVEAIVTMTTPKQTIMHNGFMHTSRRGTRIHQRFEMGHAQMRGHLCPELHNVFEVDGAGTNFRNFKNFLQSFAHKGFQAIRLNQAMFKTVLENGLEFLVLLLCVCES